MVAIVLAVSSATDGGAFEPAPLFHEPMTRPVPLRKIDWSYPRELLPERSTGLVVLRCVITETGTVEDCEVLKSVPKLTEWALEKLKRARYAPVTFEGRPIRVRYTFAVNVRLRGVPPENSPRPLRPVVPENIAQACRGQNAPVCRDTAISLLEADAGPADLDKASRLLGAACEQGVESACRTLADAFEAPRMLEDLPPPRVPVLGEEGDVSCLISAAGRAYGCIGGPGPLREWAVASVQAVKFAPARYRGRPFETEHAIHYVVPVRK
jgi:TonB family protein